MQRCLKHMSKLNKLLKKKHTYGKESIIDTSQFSQKVFRYIAVLQKLPRSKCHNTASVDLGVLQYLRQILKCNN